MPSPTAGRGGSIGVSIGTQTDATVGGRLYRRLRARFGSSLACAWFASDLGTGWSGTSRITPLADRVSGCLCSTDSTSTNNWMVVPERADDWITVSAFNDDYECAYCSSDLPCYTEDGVGGGRIFVILQRIDTLWHPTDYISPVSVKHLDDDYDAPLVCNAAATTYRSVWCDHQIWVNGVGPSDTPASPSGRHLVEVVPRYGEWKRLQIGSSRYVFAPTYYGGRNAVPDKCEIYAWWALKYGVEFTESQRALMLADCSEIYSPFSV